MKKRIFLIVLLFSLLFLAGCGVDLTSSVTLDENFSGTRVMSCAFSSSDFKRAFQGDMRDLDKLIEDSCPNGMTWKKKTQNDQTVYTFCLSFFSLQDYKEKVTNILNFHPKITWEYKDSPFVSGVIYKENFSSRDLMTWLYTALYEKKYITKDSVDDLWDLKETTVSIGNKKYKSDDKISIEEMSYAELSSIAIDTNLQDDGTFRRTISFKIPQKTLDQNGGKIARYFNGENLSWRGSSNGKTAVITITADHFTDLAAKTRQILHSDSSFGTTSLKIQKQNPFSFDIHYKEAIDVTNFVQKDGKVLVRYTMNGKQIAKDLIKQKTFDFSDTKRKRISSYEILTVWHNKKDLRRKFIFHLIDSYQKRELEKVKALFSKETILNVKIKGKTLSFVQQGSVKECQRDLTGLFPDASFEASSKHSLLRGTLTSFEDHFAFSSGNENVTGTYTLASVGNDNATQISIRPKSGISAVKKEYISERSISRLANGNENLQILAQYKIKGSEFQLSYEGNCSVSYWTSFAKIFIPLLLLVILIAFIYKRQDWIQEQINIAKKWIKEQTKRHLR